MPKITVTKIINASIDDIWHLISSIEKYPDFMPSVNAVSIVNTISETESFSSWSTTLNDSIMEWTEYDQYIYDEHRILFTQTEGDLNHMSGYWQLTQIEDSTIEITFFIEFDIGIPTLAAILDPIASEALTDNANHMLDNIARALSTNQQEAA